MQTAISYVTKIKLGGKGYAPPPDCPMLPHFKKLELFVDTLNQMQTLIEEDLTPISAVKRLINVLKKKLLKCGSDNLRTTAIETVTENLQNIAVKVLDLQLEWKNNKQMFLSMGYALPLLQWLLHTVSPHSAADYPTVFEVRVPICLISICFVLRHKYILQDLINPLK
ncbi:UNVERIFIED_CONTAM: Proliferating cell nuclear antigen-interacting partner [Trichonephila clavipes]